MRRPRREVLGREGELMPEGSKKEAASADDSKKPKEEEQNRFFKLLDNLNNTVVKITGVVVSLGLLIAAGITIDHEVRGSGNSSSRSSGTPSAHPSLISSSSASQETSATGSAEILRVTDPNQVGCYGSTLSVELNVTSRISGSGQLWVLAAVAVSGGTVYDAKAELNNTTGPQTAGVVLINSAPGSSRYLYVVSASNQAEFNWLKSNQENDGKSSWDINRRNLHGTTRVSNEIRVKTTC